MKMQWSLFTVLLIVGCAWANIDNGNNMNEELSGLADKLPADLANKLPAELPNAEEAQKLFKDKCKKLTGDDRAYDLASKAKDSLENCVKSQVNITELQQEIEDAKPSGDLDTVFGKYCKKTPTVIQCVKDFMTSVDPCLEEKEKANKKIVMNMTESLIDFLCFKDGDRIAMFIAEGGVECIQERQEAVQKCANETLGKRIPAETPTIDNLPLFVIEKEQCDDLTELQTCVVAELEKCTEPTPANIIEALFKFIKKVTPCGNMEAAAKKGEAAKRTNDAGALLASSVMIVSTLLMRYF